MKVLIIIPCYNEQDTIHELCREVRKKTTYELLVVNDGSTDSSRNILRREAIAHLDLSLNLGIGGAVQTGYRYALRNGYDIAVQLDGDGQHDPEFVEAVVAPLKNDKADLVIGSRFIRGTGDQSSATRRLGIRFFKALIFCLTGMKITDATSGFRAVNRKTMLLFDNFYPKDYPEPESTTLALRNELRVCEVPVEMRARKGGVSSISGTKSVYYMFKVSVGIIISLVKPKIKLPAQEVY